MCAGLSPSSSTHAIAYFTRHVEFGNEDVASAVAVRAEPRVFARILSCD